MNSCLPDALNIHSIRLNKVQVTMILDALDRSPCRTSVNKRRHRRQPLRGRQIVVYVQQSDRTVAFLVPTRNVSQGGLCFLHGQMMHVGTKCSMNLATRDGNWITVKGVVVRCRHVSGMTHEIGLKFQGSINPEDLQDSHR